MTIYLDDADDNTNCETVGMSKTGLNTGHRQADLDRPVGGKVKVAVHTAV